MHAIICSCYIFLYKAINWAHQPFSRLTALIDAEPSCVRSFVFTLTNSVSGSDDEEEELDRNVARFAANVVLTCSATLLDVSSRSKKNQFL